ncbi:MAG: sugar ABC transporter permease [Phycisphaeraceae bacterium]|nr:sugar ABC transporter permease [Phycisphaeraceae bacterium]
MKKALGILLLLLVIMLVTSIIAPRFCLEFNLGNLLQRTALFGIISIGVAFVIITGGIDLSIGSVVGLIGSVMAAGLAPLAKNGWGWSVPQTILTVIGLSVAIGLVHGLLVTKAKLQPFVVTLCGLLVYRGVARWLTRDAIFGFEPEHDEGLRQLAKSQPMSVPLPGTNWIAEGRWSSHLVDSATGEQVLEAGEPVAIDFWAFVDVPLPFLIMVGLALLAAGFLNLTIWGRHLLALGHSEEAARYSGIRTDRMTILAYVICSTLAGIGGILFALDVGTIQPPIHGNFYELYAIAAAVLGGCSLRGGEGSIFGVVIGAAVMRVLYNSINMIGIPTQLEFVIIGVVILAGVTTDTMVKSLVRKRRK